MTASRTSACVFTTLAAAHTAELLAVACYLPWPRLVLAPALLTTTAATCAAHEWTALHTRPPADRNSR
ncbi:MULTISPECIES: hypothetical protein [unclassified Streptomyces]|uniref:hypothetical protein n=1 Tax=unclassified Streptomyces TaxID=2593676 RepID=UPI001F471B00|nr:MULTISPECIES: hypothetical protein [unclassified Streptomyces]MCF0086659.1 hypothetical protein [Streptomyces sp. MH192]MCF0098813.1 hypothetical protein [Streptomyces sp. MH191]